MALGCGLVWWRADHLASRPLAWPRVATFSAKVEAVDLLTARRTVRLLLAPVGEPLLPRRVRVNVDQDKVSPTLSPGALVRLRARLMPPPPAALPGAYDFARFAWFKGIGATGRALDPVELLAPPSLDSAGRWIASVRARLTAHVHRSLAGSEGGVAASLVTGDQGGISEADAEAMRTSGLAHLLSISGLHVGVVVGGTMLLTLRLLALSPMLALRWPLPLVAAGFGAAAGAAYTLLAGAEVPTVRSCIAALLVLIALAMGREAMTLRLVAAGALVVLLIWPEALVGASFQLSFAAVTTIVVLHEHPRIRSWFARREEAQGIRLARGLASLLLTGVAIELVLTPIALFHFHRSGAYGALANIVAIPFTTFVVMPIEALALLFDVVSWGAPFWWLTGHALGALLALAHWISNLPGAVAAVPSMPVAAFGLMVAGALWVTLWRKRMRLWGVPFFIAGLAWALSTPSPDLLVTGDGRHLAIRATDGQLALLRPRTGDYLRDMMSETAAGAGFSEIEFEPSARCNADLCLIDVARGGRSLRLLATRSPYFVRWSDMNLACSEADIVISERRLPDACRPRWIKADRPFLRETGGLAIDVESLSVRTARPVRDDHPW